MRVIIFFSANINSNNNLRKKFSTILFCFSNPTYYICTHPPSPESPGVYRISDFFQPRSMDFFARYRKDNAVLQRPTEHEEPLGKQGTFAKARKRRRMRLIKTDRLQKGMAVVFVDDRRQQNTEPPSEREVLPQLSSR
ncbi:hypothetical protein CDAR_168961 [Caerostris darwini]|uniref:Uncharacterized protein n=1 Tax=Caerostris darwini TaxID=1538125 RepID=A0AAV4WPZ0_9ARAC|nr:hypothetical protein CDAR_168961 [Caerostris darwini]